MMTKPPRFIFAMPGLYGLVLCAMTLASPVQRNRPDFWSATNPIWYVLAFSLVSFVVAALVYPPLKDEEPTPNDWPDLAGLPRFERPAINGRLVQLCVDPERRVLYCRRSATPIRFLAVPLRFASVGFDEILSARRVVGKACALRIVTKDVTVEYIDEEPEIRRAAKLLDSIGNEVETGGEWKESLVVLLSMGTGLLGALAGAWTTTPAMDSLHFYGRILGGAAVAVGVLFSLLRPAKKWLRDYAAPALLASIAGAVGGCLAVRTLASSIDPEFVRTLFGRDGAFTVAAGGGLLGALVGFGFVAWLRHRSNILERTDLIAKKKPIPEL